MRVVRVSTGYVQSPGFNPESNVPHPFTALPLRATLTPPPGHSTMLSFLHKEMAWLADLALFAVNAGRRTLLWRTMGFHISLMPAVFDQADALHFEFRSGASTEMYYGFIPTTEDRRYLVRLDFAGFRMLYSYHQVCREAPFQETCCSSFVLADQNVWVQCRNEYVCRGS